VTVPFREAEYESLPARRPPGLPSPVKSLQGQTAAGKAPAPGLGLSQEREQDLICKSNALGSSCSGHTASNSDIFQITLWPTMSSDRSERSAGRRPAVPPQAFHQDQVCKQIVEMSLCETSASVTTPDQDVQSLAPKCERISLYSS
jgi:hypothetical protein